MKTKKSKKTKSSKTLRQVQIVALDAVRSQLRDEAHVFRKLSKNGNKQMEWNLTRCLLLDEAAYWYRDYLIFKEREEEAQPCQCCTNGIIRSVGRDNEEIIDDCPRCSARKEAKP